MASQQVKFSMITYIIGAIAIGGYLGGAILQYFSLTGSSTTQNSRVVLIGAFALILHLVSFNGTLYLSGGFDLGIYNMVSLIGWLVACLALLISQKTPLQNSLIGAYPLAALGLIFALAFSPRSVSLDQVSTQIASHILLSLVAYSILTIAAVQGVILAIQDNHLRHQSVNRLIMGLPPLQVMEKLLFELIGVGLLFLTAAIVTGMIFLEDMFAQHLAHKTILSVLAWVIFSALLTGRHFLGWRGTMAIRFTIGGYLLLMLAYLGSKLVLEIILKR